MQVSIKRFDAVEPSEEELELESEMDEMWSFVGNKSNQRWLWHAIDHNSGKVLAYVFGSRKDKVFSELQALLKPFDIRHFYTDDWGAYERNLVKNNHTMT